MDDKHLDIPDLTQKLAQQLRFIKRSCDAYDEGDEDEAIRIAQACRVLFHSGSGQPLIHQLRGKNTRLLTTASKPDNIFPGSKTVEFYGFGLYEFSISGNMSAATYTPDLSPPSTSARYLKLKYWWTEPVIILASQPISRGMIILETASKEGGAHVSPNLHNDYRLLKSDGAVGTLGIETDGMVVEEPIKNAQLVSLRQIGHEVLNSPDIIKLSSPG